MKDLIRWSWAMRRQAVAKDGSLVLRSEADVVRTAGPPTSLANAARRCAVLLGTLYMLGCSSSQVAPDYAGEPLAVLRGALSADAGFEPSMPGGGMTVGLVWLVSSHDGGKSPLVAETAHTDGQFPFGFRLTISSPPGPEAQSDLCLSGDCAEVEPSPVYQGLVAALDEHADLGHVTPLDILGASIDYGIFYFARDAQPSAGLYDQVAAAAAIYNVPPVRGYHLYAIQKDQDVFAAERRCWANGLCVENKVPGGPAAQYWPDHAFEECLALVPDAITCTSYPETCGRTADSCSTYFDDLGVEPTPAELTEHARCEELSSEHLPPEDCGGSAWQFPGNPLGFEANVSIRLGAGLYEFIN